ADRDLQQLAAARPHRPQVGALHLGHDGDLLAHCERADVGVLAALVVPARKVVQQVTDGLQLQVAGQRLRRLLAEHLAQRRLQVRHSTPTTNGYRGGPPGSSTTSTNGHRSPTWSRSSGPSSGGAWSPVTSVTSSPPAASIRSTSSRQVGASSVPMRLTSPSISAMTSPGWQTPATVTASRTAKVTSAYRHAPAASAIATRSSSKRRPGSRTASAASACTGDRVGTTPTRTPSARASVAAAAATACTGPAFGSTTASVAPERRIAARIS